MRSIIALLILCLVEIGCSPVKIITGETKVFHKPCVRNTQDELNLCSLREEANEKVDMFKNKVALAICHDKRFDIYKGDTLLIIGDLSENPYVGTEPYTGFYKDKIFGFIYNYVNDSITELDELEPSNHYDSDLVDNLVERNYSVIKQGIQADSCDGWGSSGAYYYQAFVIDHFDKESMSFDALIIDNSKSTRIYYYDVSD